MKNEKIYLEIWWTATFPQNWALICLTVCEKTRFMDEGRLRHGICSADTVKQSYKWRNIRILSRYCIVFVTAVSMRDDISHFHSRA